jgi:hypothetical protein
MYIILQNPGDTMVLDTTRGHLATYQKLTAFLASSQASIELPAGSRCPACTEAETLSSFRMVKTPGLILTQHLPGSVLQVSGRTELLERYAEVFRFDADEVGGHRHPEQRFWGELEPGSDMIFVEVEDDLDDPDAWLPPA